MARTWNATSRSPSYCETRRGGRLVDPDFGLALFVELLNELRRGSASMEVALSLEPKMESPARKGSQAAQSAAE
jgi:hypothetical protein